MTSRDNKLLTGIEFALVLVLAVCMNYTVLGGFNVAESIHANVLLNLVICAVAQCILFVGVVKPKLKVGAYVCYAILAVVVCTATVVASSASNPIADISENLFVTAVVFAVVNLAVFACSRKRFSSIVLLGIGAFVCGLIQFLYTMNMLVATAVFLLAALMLIALKGYAEAAMGLPGSALPLFKGASLVGILLPLVACAIAGVVVIGVIMPLNPPHAEIKLQTVYMAYEEEHVKTGVELDAQADDSVTSSSVDESLEPRTTTDKKLDESSDQAADSPTSSDSDDNDYLSDKFSDVDLSGALDNLKTLALNPQIPWIPIIVALIVFIALLLTLPRYIIHRMRLKRIAAMAPGKQVLALYAFFLSRFKKLGIGKPDVLSPIEYANLFRERLYPYVGAQEACTFDHLTALFVWQSYGAAPPSQDDLDCMYHLYNEFYANCRKKLGLLRYGLRYITL